MTKYICSGMTVVTPRSRKAHVLSTDRKSGTAILTDGKSYWSEYTAKLTVVSYGGVR